MADFRNPSHIILSESERTRDARALGGFLCLPFLPDRRSSLIVRTAGNSLTECNPVQIWAMGEEAKTPTERQAGLAVALGVSVGLTALPCRVSRTNGSLPGLRTGRKAKIFDFFIKSYHSDAGARS
jgi:hypothetical protein